jgi:hypothetical protein
MDIKSLKEKYKNYYRNKLKIKDTYDLYNNTINQNIKIINEIKLCENHDELGDSDLSIMNILNTLRNNYNNLYTLIMNLNTEDHEKIADLIGHFFYENICVNNPEHDELLYICFLLLEKEINELEDPNSNGFLENSFIGKLLKNLNKRTDVKNYLSLTVKDILLKLENLSENFMEIDLDKINEYLKFIKNDDIINSSIFLEKERLYFLDKLRREEKNKQKNYKEKDYKLEIKKENELFNNNIYNDQKFEAYSLPQNKSNLLNKSQSINYNINDINTDSDTDNNISDYKNEYEEVLCDLTDEEIINKYKNEKDEEMKVYCKIYLYIL